MLFRSTLVGLELRPRRSRDAATLFSIVARAQGSAGRDAVWDHPDLLPGTQDLDDPSGYLVRREAAENEHADVDAALAEIFGEEDAADDRPNDDEPADDGPNDENAPDDEDRPSDGPTDGPDDQTKDDKTKDDQAK